MILAIDLGSTSFKACLFDAGLRRVRTGSCELNYRYAPGGVVELAAEHVLDALRAVISGAMAGVEAAGVRAVAIASQAQTFAIAGADFSPRTPFVSWLDTRATRSGEALAKEPAFADLARHVSFPTMLPALMLCQLRHLHDTRPTELSGDRRIVPLPSFVAALLMGEPVCDANLAAMSGLYSMELGTWWPAALAACGVSADQLPRLVEVGGVAGRTSEAAEALGLPAGAAVVLAGNDQTAGAYGAGVHEDDSILITLGTCQVAYRSSDQPPRSPRSTVAGPYPGGRWYTMAADVCGGNLINWAKTVLAGCGTDEAFFAAAEAPRPGCDGLAFEIGPNADDNAWLHASAGHGAGEFARSVLDALVERMVGLVGQLAGGAAPAGRVLVGGGGSRSSLWTGMLSSALGRPLERTDGDPLVGAARMALSAGLGD